MTVSVVVPGFVGVVGSLATSSRTLSSGFEANVEVALGAAEVDNERDPIDDPAGCSEDKIPPTPGSRPYDPRLLVLFLPPVSEAAEAVEVLLLRVYWPGSRFLMYEGRLAM